MKPLSLKFLFRIYNPSSSSGCTVMINIRITMHTATILVELNTGSTAFIPQAACKTSSRICHTRNNKNIIVTQLITATLTLEYFATLLPDRNKHRITN